MFSGARDVGDVSRRQDYARQGGQGILLLYFLEISWKIDIRLQYDKLVAGPWNGIPLGG